MTNSVSGIDPLTLSILTFARKEVPQIADEWALLNP